jgi:LysR family positive regulator for ilvC
LVDIPQLKNYITLAEQLHFGRASRLCHLSPSALTRTIQRLEDELGSALFIRDKRTVQLTTAGETFLAYARQALLDYRDLKYSLSSRQQVAGTLSLYASITAVYSVLPDLLEACRKGYPEIQLELHTGVAETAVAQVENGEIDIAVAALPEQRRDALEFLPIMTTPLVFIAGTALADQVGSDEVPDLAQLPLVVPQSGLSRRRLEVWLKKNRVTPQIRCEVSGNEAIIPMVHLGGGVGIVPQLVLERSPFREQVVVLERAPALEPYVVGLCSSQRNLQKSCVKAFWSLAEAELA